MTQPNEPNSEKETRYHAYTTHRIPWYIRAMWICFWIGLIWYVVKYAIPAAKNYF